jgi:hypothetical protein
MYESDNIEEQFAKLYRFSCQKRSDPDPVQLFRIRHDPAPKHC